jgi:hypothetical protein
MGHIVVAQHIRTKWTKASCGGEDAVRRNGVPEAANVPVQRIPKGNLILVHHVLQYREADGFRQPKEEIRVNPALQMLALGCVTVYHTTDEVIATFRYNYDSGCKPNRGWARKTLRLTLNEWGQIVYNGRFVPGWDGDQWYRKTVVNVGMVERLTPGLFTREEPTCRFSAMAELF